LDFVLLLRKLSFSRCQWQNHTKLLKFHFYVGDFSITAQFESKINSIFEISAKNCIRSDGFWQKKFFHEKSTCGEPWQNFLKVGLKGTTGQFFVEKLLLPKISELMQSFALIWNIIFILL